MSVLVYSGSPHLLNMGDVAMLQALAERVRTLWRAPKVSVITGDPARLQRFCPGSTPVDHGWFQHQFNGPLLPAPLTRVLPRGVKQSLQSWERRISAGRPATAQSIQEWKLKAKPRRPGLLADALKATRTATTVISTGGGILTDSFKGEARLVLLALKAAIQRGIPTAMFGQGIGPLTDPELLALAGDVLPKVDLIALRERQRGPQLLAKLGVSSSRILVTGDDAIELAYRQRRESLGDRIGINVRQASYAGLSRELIDPLREHLLQAAQTLGTELHPVPISLHPGESDLETIAAVLNRKDLEAAHFDSPELVIQSASRCRVVVTGSYHGAVFSLAQGIPVVALCQSRYYQDKFHGLANQFGVGCEVIVIDPISELKRLPALIERLWHEAPRMRAEILASAEKQVELSRAAYRRFYQMLEAA
jgi:Uncharacterized conserved protein